MLLLNTYKRTWQALAGQTVPVPSEREPGYRPDLAVRTERDPAAMTSELRRLMREASPDLANRHVHDDGPGGGRLP
jgi:hypothetical protein